MGWLVVGGLVRAAVGRALKSCTILSPFRSYSCIASEDGRRGNEHHGAPEEQRNNLGSHGARREEATPTSGKTQNVVTGAVLPSSANSLIVSRYLSGSDRSDFIHPLQPCIKALATCRTRALGR